MQQQQHHHKLLAVRNASKTNPVEEWLGIKTLIRLLRILRLPNEETLNVVYMIYKAMALAPKAFKVGELQDDINTKIVTCKKRFTTVVFSDTHFSNFTSLRWGRISDDSVTIEVVDNLYLWGEVDLEKHQTINHEVELTREGGLQYPVPMPGKY